MRIFITGGTGFIGQHLVRQLSKEGHELFVLARSQVMGNKLSAENVKIIFGDINNCDSYRRVFDNNIEVVYHLAAVAGNWKKVKRSYYYKTNVQATEELLKASYDRIKKFVYCSSMSASEMMIASGGEYSRSKKEAEEKVIEYEKKGLTTLIIRPAIVYGPGDLGPVYKICQLVKKGLTFVIGSGKNLLPLVYIDDLIKVFVTAGLEKEAGIREVVGPSESFENIIKVIAKDIQVKFRIIKIPKIFAWSAAWLIENLYKAFNQEPLLTRQRVAVLTSDINSEDQRLNVPHERPMTNFGEGIKKTINWYQENGYL